MFATMIHQSLNCSGMVTAIIAIHDQNVAVDVKVTMNAKITSAAPNVMVSKMFLVVDGVRMQVIPHFWVIGVIVSSFGICSIFVHPTRSLLDTHCTVVN